MEIPLLKMNPSNATSMVDELHFCIKMAQKSRKAPNSVFWKKKRFFGSELSTYKYTKIICYIGRFGTTGNIRKHV